MEIFTNILFYFEYIFWFIFVFTIIVFVHEFGHYYVARLNKVKVNIFSIGFGPSILKFKDKNNKEIPFMELIDVKKGSTNVRTA